ncbi:acyl-CoA dehydrogenase family protein [Corynebacterium variabile]|uniref:acyl-CoA dehydrogenase family protein n=1 Tax=Corynebacterium variabile TaxID=1727 RepID=UPI0026487A23|nr:acyl-CoA dehydrogenase family protein [Corynebacterium variabile]MDN6241874.1 acyl-CoA dehydrogenase family protein [Corynebacterium variabile]MDN6659008.1 acyl-CoA dehydrogenase family protein [Acidipropionibacterium jensenii]MDN6845518.1 acyl-CoA dehydrogenase family protein [Corynebacterium variabile]
MNLELTPEEVAFRDNLRAIFREVPQEIRDRNRAGQTTRQDIIDSQQVLNRHGVAVPHWPVEYGGQDWTPTQSHIFTNELQRSGIPEPLPFNVGMVGPVIANFATDEIKEKFLAKTANLDIWWSQGFSEPGAGSDLAGLKTTAVRDGDHYVVNGQKTWTTLGQFGQWMFLLARTDPNADKPQKGISFLLVDMETPGIDRRPIRLIDGSVEVNEFFFTDVRVPVENLIGEENKGWTYAKFLLGNERNGMAQIGSSQRMYTALVSLATDREVNGHRLIDDPEFRRRLYTVKLRLTALEATTMRVTSASENGKPSPLSSLLKIEGSRILQELDDLAVSSLGTDGVEVTGAAPGTRAFDGDAVAEYLNHRKFSIYGGSNEVQAGVIAKGILGL